MRDKGKDKLTRQMDRPHSLDTAVQQALSLHQAGHLHEAESVYREILLHDPENIFVRNHMGICYAQQGNLKEAKKILSDAVALKPDDYLSHYNLAIVLASQDNHNKAMLHLNLALKINPDSADAHFSLGEIFRQQGRTDEAMLRYRKALDVSHDHLKSCFNLGQLLLGQERLKDAINIFQSALNYHSHNALLHRKLGDCFLQAGDYERAIVSYRNALNIGPEEVEIHYKLGGILAGKRLFDEAVHHYQRAVTLKPDFTKALIKLGITYKLRADDDEAIACYRRALELEPESPELHVMMGEVYLHKRDPDNALACYQRALALAEDNAAVYGYMGHALKLKGKQDAAAGCFRQALKLAPHYAEMYFHLVGLKQYFNYDQDIQAIQEMLSRDEIAEADKIYLNFALGRAYEALEQYDEAFVYLAEGNRMVRKTFSFSISRTEAEFRELMDIFNEQFFAERVGTGCGDETPVFVLGMPRSGTSLVEQILSSHSKIWGAGELSDLGKILTHALPNRLNTRFPAFVRDLKGADFTRLGEQYVGLLRHHSDTASYIIDKTLHNFLCVGMIRLMLPRARIIHCVRNPVDTCFSCYKQHFNGAHHYSYDLAELGRYFRLYQTVMDHWQSLLPGYIFTVRYEELVKDQEGQTRQLLEYLGLPWEAGCLDFHKAERVVMTASTTQVRQKIYHSALGHWENYKKHLGPLLDALEYH